MILLISTTWLATLLVVVAACRMAAHGDRAPLPHAERSPRLFDIPALWEQGLSLKLEDRRATPLAERSKASTAEHVWHSAQEDLYVSP